MSELEKKRILLAEDDASMRRFVEIVLRQAGYRVETAEDGLKALQIALAADFAAVVADAVMPNLSGFDLCRMVRAEKSENVAFVILSGLAEDSSNESAAAIADVYLVKDASLKKNLLAALKGLL